MSGRVRGLSPGDAHMALEVCDTRDFGGTLGNPYRRQARKPRLLYNAGWGWVRATVASEMRRK
jgi:hypothetical protein